VTRRRDFNTINARSRMHRQGFEEANPKATHYPAMHGKEVARAEHLEAYLRISPKGERDLEPLLDTPERKERDTWLREVLDACED